MRNTGIGACNNIVNLRKITCGISSKASRRGEKAGVSGVIREFRACLRASAAPQGLFKSLSLNN